MSYSCKKKKKWQYNEPHRHYLSKRGQTQHNTYCIKPYMVIKLWPSLVTPWTIVHQAPLSIGFPSQEYWSGLPFLSTGDLPNPGIKPRSPALKMVSCIAGILYAFNYVQQELKKSIYHTRNQNNGYLWEGALTEKNHNENALYLDLSGGHKA